MAPQTFKATFNSTSWDEKPIQTGVSANGPKQTIVTEERRYEGDMAGDAAATYCMTYHEGSNDEVCSFDGQQLFTGTLAGKKGSLVVRASGTYDRGAIKTTWTVVPEACTGELKGTTGTGGYSVAPGQKEAFGAELCVEMP